MGALIMGISYALFEEKIMDRLRGRMLNPDMEFYRLAGLNDIPELVVHMMTGKGYDERGVIGLGEPPVISPGAAISNAVANALGMRVAFLPHDSRSRAGAPSRRRQVHNASFRIRKSQPNEASGRPAERNLGADAKSSRAEPTCSRS